MQSPSVHAPDGGLKIDLECPSCGDMIPALVASHAARNQAVCSCGHDFDLRNCHGLAEVAQFVIDLTRTAVSTSKCSFTPE